MDKKRKEVISLGKEDAQEQRIHWRNKVKQYITKHNIEHPPCQVKSCKETYTHIHIIDPFTKPYEVLFLCPSHMNRLFNPSEDDAFFYAEKDDLDPIDVRTLDSDQQGLSRQAANKRLNRWINKNDRKSQLYPQECMLCKTELFKPVKVIPNPNKPYNIFFMCHSCKGKYYTNPSRYRLEPLNVKQLLNEKTDSLEYDDPEVTKKALEKCLRILSSTLRISLPKKCSHCKQTHPETKNITVFPYPNPLRVGIFCKDCQNILESYDEMRMELLNQKTGDEIYNLENRINNDYKVSELYQQIREEEAITEQIQTETKKDTSWRDMFDSDEESPEESPEERRANTEESRQEFIKDLVEEPTSPLESESSEKSTDWRSFFKDEEEEEEE